MISKNLIYLAMLAFLISAATALAFKGEKTNLSTIVSNLRKESFPDLPRLNDSVSFPVVSAQGAVAVDLDSLVVLYDKSSGLKLLPASTTKIMTALVAMDYYPDNFIIEVSEIAVEGQTMGLKKGELITVKDLLYGLLVYSANDAAEVLAQNFPGGRDLFVIAMNTKAKRLNLTSTHFVNPTGLDGEGHYSTAKDMVQLAAYAVKDPKFLNFVGTKEITVESLDGRIKHRLTNINSLLGKVDGIRGVKTGWTENARENMVTLVERDGKRVMISLLGSQDRFGETEELVDWIFSNFTWEKVFGPQTFSYSP